MDVCASREIEPPALVARDAFRQSEILKFQMPDLDVETGKHRRIGIARVEFRQSLQLAASDYQRTNIEPVVRPGERAPVDLRARYGQEHALGIGQRQVVENRIAIDVALDPPDLDPQAVLRLQIGDLVGDPALPDGRVEPRDQPRH